MYLLLVLGRFVDEKARYHRLAEDQRPQTSHQRRRRGRHAAGGGSRYQSHGYGHVRFGETQSR